MDRAKYKIIASDLDGTLLDSSIICSAGLGLAVSNACDSLKKVADGIICSNDEHIVRFILKNYFEKD